MPSFQVIIDRHTTETVIITVEAENEDAAREDAEAQIEKWETGDSISTDWELEDQSYEIVDVDEE